MGIMQRFLGAVSFGSVTATSLTATTATIGSTTTTGLNTESVANGLTASATQTLAGGTALTKRINRVTTVAASGNAVTLPALGIGQSVDIYNAGANPMKVFPNASGVAIDGGTAGASVTLTNALRCRFTCVAANTVISAQLGAVSA